MAKDTGGSDKHLDDQLLQQLEDYKHHYGQLDEAWRKAGVATEASEVLPPPQEAESQTLLRDYQSKRRELLEKAADLDSRLLTPDILAEVVAKDVQAAPEPTVEWDTVSASLRQFYSSRSAILRTQLAMFRSRLHREHFAAGGSLDDANSKVRREALQVLNLEIESCQRRAARLRSSSSTGPTIADLIVRLRHVAVEQAALMPLKSFSAQVKYMNYSSRVRMWRRALEYRAVASQVALTTAASVVPLGVTSRKQLEKALQVLGPSYGCTGSLSIYKGKAFAHQVTMEFPRLFKIQERKMDFKIAQPTKGPNFDVGIKADDESEHSAAEKDEGVASTVLEPSYWIDRLPWTPKTFREVEEQRLLIKASYLGGRLPTRIQHAKPSYARELLQTILASAARKGESKQLESWEPSVDSLLAAELAFIKVNNAEVVARRFHEVGEEYEASTKYVVQSHTTAEEDGGGGIIQGPLLRAHGMLRHLECCRLRRELLDRLNFYRGVQRWLLEGHKMEDESGSPGGGPHAETTDRPKSTSPWQHSLEELQEATRSCSIPSLLGTDDGAGRQQKVPGLGGLAVTASGTHPVDGSGRPLMHQAALSDLASLEEEMIEIGSYYIHRFEAGSPEEPEHKLVDRIGVLFDLYASELQYHGEKQRLLQGYLAIYEHTCCSEERDALAQRMIDIIAMRPLLDLDAAYFTESYATCAAALEARTSLMNKLLTHQAQFERSVTSRAAACCNAEQGGDAMAMASSLSDVGFLKDLAHPLEGLPLAATSLSGKVFTPAPGAAEVDFTELFASLHHVWKVELIIESAHEELVANLRPGSIPLVGQLERACYTTALEQWQQFIDKQAMVSPSAIWTMHDDPEVLRDILLEAIRQLNALGDVEQQPTAASAAAAARFDLEVDGDMMQAFADVRKHGGETQEPSEVLRQLLVALLEHFEIRKKLRSVSLEVSSLERSLTGQATMCGLRLDALRPNPLLEHHWSESRSYTPDKGRSSTQLNAWMNEKFGFEFFAGTVSFEMAQLDLSTPRSVVMNCASARLQELRLLHQNQVAYHSLLLSCVQVNVLLIDPSSRQKELADVELIGPSRDLVLNDPCVARLRKLCDSAVLAAPPRRDEPTSSSKKAAVASRPPPPQSKPKGKSLDHQGAHMDASRYARHMQTPLSLVEQARVHLGALFEQEAASLKQECLGITETERRLGILKYRILVTLSLHMGALAYSSLLRVQAASQATGLRRVLALLPARLSPFAAAQGGERRRPLLEKDGSVGSICTVPTALEALQLWNNNIPWDMNLIPIAAQLQELWPKTAAASRFWIQLDRSGSHSMSHRGSILATPPRVTSKEGRKLSVFSQPSGGMTSTSFGPLGAGDTEPYALTLLKLLHSLTLLAVLQYSVATIDGDHLVLLRTQRLIRMSDADDEFHDFLGDVLSNVEPSYEALERMSQKLAAVLQSPQLARQPKAAQVLQVLHCEIQREHRQLLAVLRMSAQKALQDSAPEDAAMLLKGVQDAEKRAVQEDIVTAFLPIFFKLDEDDGLQVGSNGDSQSLVCSLSSLHSWMTVIPFEKLLSTFCFLPGNRRREVSLINADLVAKRDALQSYHSVSGEERTAKMDVRFFGSLYLNHILQELVSKGHLGVQDMSTFYFQAEAVQVAWAVASAQSLQLKHQAVASREVASELEECKAKLRLEAHMAPKAPVGSEVDAEISRLESGNLMLISALEQVWQAAVNERVRQQLQQLAVLRYQHLSQRFEVMLDGSAQRLSERDGSIVAAKVDIVLRAVNKLKKQGTHIRMGQKGISDERAYAFREEDLNECVQEVSLEVQSWGEDVLADRQALVEDVKTFLQFQAGTISQRGEASRNHWLATLTKQGLAEAVQSAVVDRSCLLISEVDQLHRTIRDVKDTSCQLDHRLNSEIWQRVRTAMSSLSDRLEQAVGNFHESRLDCGHRVGDEIRKIREHTHAQLAALAAKNYEVQRIAASDMVPSSVTSKQGARIVEPQPSPTSNYKVSDEMHNRLAEVAKRDDVSVLNAEIQGLKDRVICLRAFHLFKKEAMLSKFEKQMQALHTTLGSNRALWERYAQVSKRHEIVEKNFAKTARQLTIAEGEEENLRSKVESVVEHRKKLQSDQHNKSRQLSGLAAKVKEHQMHGHLNLQRMHRELIQKQETLQRLKAERAQDEQTASQVAVEGRTATATEKSAMQKQRAAKEMANLHLTAVKADMSRSNLDEEQRFRLWRSRVDEAKQRLHQAEDENRRLRRQLHDDVGDED